MELNLVTLANQTFSNSFHKNYTSQNQAKLAIFEQLILKLIPLWKLKKIVY